MDGGVLTEFQDRPASVRWSYDPVFGLISQWVQGELESDHVEFLDCLGICYPLALAIGDGVAYSVVSVVSALLACCSLYRDSVCSVFAHRGFCSFFLAPAGNGRSPLFLLQSSTVCLCKPDFQYFCVYLIPTVLCTVLHFLPDCEGSGPVFPSRFIGT